MNYALRIENLLTLKNPSAMGRRHWIEKNPYLEIKELLIGRVSKIALEKFCTYYKGIEEKSIEYLLKTNYNVEQLISDLKQIIGEK